MLRGINRQDLFHDADDLWKIIDVLSEYVDVCGFYVHGYCLMTNHVHLLVQQNGKPGSETLAQFMKRIGISYVWYYNRKYERVGSLFQDRYKSEAVETDSYFMTVLRYIHRNPVKAGIVKSPSEYIWSSYSAYTGTPSFVYTDFGNALLGGRYSEFMEDDDKVECLDI